MTHDEQEENETQCLQAWKDKFILINREFEDKLWNEISKRVMEVCYKKNLLQVREKSGAVPS